MQRRLVGLSTVLLALYLNLVATPASATTVYSQLPTFSVASAVSDIAFSLDGTQAYIAQGNNSNCSIAVVDTATQLVSATVNIPCGSTDSIGAIRMMPNGATLWVATDKVIYAVETANLNISVALDGSSIGALHFRGFSFSADSTSAYVSTLQAAVYRYDTTGLASRSPTYTYNIGSHASYANNAVVSADGLHLLVTSTGPNSKVISFPLTSSGYDPETSVTLTGTAYSLVISPDSNQIYVAQGNAGSPAIHIGVYQATTDLASGTLILVSSLPKSLSISPDGTTLLAAQVGQSFSTIELATSTVTDHALTGYSDSIVAAFNPTGSQAYLAQSSSSTIQPIGISPPVGPVTPTPPPTPTPVPNTLPNTGVSVVMLLSLSSLTFATVISGIFLILFVQNRARNRAGAVK